ncbi:MAG: bifunctional pyr operon transcriptional regulator/uracil phosphoribosyltransferase PyrR [Ichthyobacteriaceae bacterium]|nr:bifunctional pyr operon transcriptional regulator/uracil phosphoribosyltransferase PyrR [Ichthyobacteriaceae bacterium]
MSEKIQLIGAKEIEITLQRLACQLIENHGNFKNTVLIGIQNRGAVLADRIKSILENTYGLKDLKLGYLDITFFRDDFRRGGETITANQTKIDFLVEDVNVVFIDDVLHSGRSVRAALTAIQSFGRPSNIELMVFVDRRFSRSLPIQPDYKGRKVDSYENEKVVLELKEKDGTDGVYIEQKKQK